MVSLAQSCNVLRCWWFLKPLAQQGGPWGMDVSLMGPAIIQYPPATAVKLRQTVEFWCISRPTESTQSGYPSISMKTSDLRHQIGIELPGRRRSQGHGIPQRAMRAPHFLRDAQDLPLTTRKRSLKGLVTLTIEIIRNEYAFSISIYFLYFNKCARMCSISIQCIQRNAIWFYDVLPTQVHT